MDITISIPDKQSDRFINSMASIYGYEDFVSVSKDVKDKVTKEITTITQAVANPETKADFVKRRLLEELISKIKGYESDSAVSKALANIPQPELLVAKIV